MALHQYAFSFASLERDEYEALFSRVRRQSWNDIRPDFKTKIVVFEIEDPINFDLLGIPSICKLTELVHKYQIENLEALFR